MAGTNGVAKYARVNREDELTPFSYRDVAVHTFTPPTSANAGSIALPAGNIISTTQVPSTNPAPTNLTAQQFATSPIYFDVGTTNSPINAPTVSSFLNYLAQVRGVTLTPFMSYDVFFINTKPQATNNTVVIQFPDAAWNREGVGIVIFPQQITKETFTFVGANNPATAEATGANGEIDNISQSLNIFNNTNGVVNPTLQTFTAGLGANTSAQDWEVNRFVVTNTSFGNAVRSAAGNHDALLELQINTGLTVNGGIGYNAGTGGYHIICQTTGNPAPNAVVFYVKADGTMRANLSASATYNTAVLFDPLTGEFGRAVSSQRYKENIVNATDADLGFLANVTPRVFNYKPAFGGDAAKKVVGVIAEELEAILPANLKANIIEYEPDPDHPGQTLISGINNNQLVPLLLAQQRRLLDKIAALDARITVLEA